MEKKLYYELTNNFDMNVTADLSSCMQIIEGNVSDNKEDVGEVIFELKPVLLTDQEYLDLGESEDY